MKKFKEDLEYFVKDFYYLASVILTAILSFGFVITHYSVNIDTLSFTRYYDGSELIAQGRFGSVFLNQIFHIFKFDPFYVDLFAVIFLVLASILLCMMFKSLIKNKLSMISYILFSCLFISYPLIHEIFVYTPASLSIGLGFFTIGVIGLILVYHMEEKFKWTQSMIITLLLTLILSIYESFAPVYLCLICAILFVDLLLNNKKYKWKDLFIRIVNWLIPLVLSIILMKLIVKLLIVIFSVTGPSRAANQIYYFTNGIVPTIKRLFYSIIENYVIKSLFYFPIFVLMVMMILFFFFGIYQSVKRKNGKILLMTLGTISTLFALSIVQGYASPYRTCQVFPFFIATVSLILSYYVLQNKSKYFKAFILILFSLTIFYQTKELHKYFYLNYLRYDHEKTVLTDILNDLEDYDTSKPVVFIGGLDLPEFISKEVSIPTDSLRYQIVKKLYKNPIPLRIPEANISPYISWAIYAFEEPNTELFKWVTMLGYSLKQGTIEMYNEAMKYQSILERYPKKGYIYELKDFIIVNI